jgi:putative DNA primase/helicase
MRARLFRVGDVRPKKLKPVDQSAKTQRPAIVTPDLIQVPGPISGRASDVKLRKIRWVWPGRFAVKLNILCGNPDAAKSIIALDIVARITTGTDWFDCPNTNPPGEALILAAEDDWDDTVAPRLKAAGADLSRVHWLKMGANENGSQQERELQLDRDMRVLADFLKKFPKISVVVIDPISSYLGGAKMVDEQGARAILQPLKELADKCGVCIIAVMHLNKKTELDAIHRIGGAMAFVGVARMVWLCAPKPAVEFEPDDFTMYMVKIKGNIVTKKLRGLAYVTDAKMIRMEGGEDAVPFVKWIGHVDQAANEIASPTKATGNRGAGRPALQTTAAVMWLREFLKPGPVELKELESAGKAVHGFSTSTLDRARSSAKVITFKSSKNEKNKDVYSCRLPDPNTGEQTVDLNSKN